MKRTTHTRITVLLLSAAAGFAQDATYDKTKLMIGEPGKQKLAKVQLQCSGTALLAAGKKDVERLEIPYAAISNIAYERVERRRTNEGAAVAVVSLGAGVAIMFTKTQSHWLGIDYTGASGPRKAILQLHKDEVESAISDCEAKWGKKIERVAENEHRINAAAGSHNMDELVSYSPEQLIPAVKQAMEKYSCAIAKEKRGEIECKRAKTSNSEITGIGGETVKARLESKGASTRVRIDTDRGFNGKYAKKNWSTPIFQAMMDALKSNGN